MDVRPGYKQTEAGVIPEEWEVARLDDCLDLLTDFEANGSFEDVAKNVHVLDSEGFAWYVRATDLKNEGPLSSLRYVDRHSYRFLKKTALFGGEVLITKRGEIGKVYLFEKRTSHATLAPNLYLLKLNTRVVPNFVFAYFKYGNGNRTLKSIDASTTLGALYKNDVKAIAVPLPTLPEQRAITAALSDVDALLAKLDQLIAKKHNLKQAVMQQLLTRQTRLPGFSGAWEVKRLGEIAEIAMGRTPSRLKAAYWGVGYKWLSIADLQTKFITDSKEEITPLASAQMAIIPKGTLLMSFKLSIGRLAFAGCDLFTNEAICSFNKLRADAAFLYYALERVNFTLYGKQAVKGYTLNKESLKQVEVRVPSHEEQTAIVTILSDMDAEIASLEAQRDKIQALKQGMMQELLTGRIRLV